MSLYEQAHDVQDLACLNHPHRVKLSGDRACGGKVSPSVNSESISVPLKPLREAVNAGRKVNQPLSPDRETRHSFISAGGNRISLVPSGIELIEQRRIAPAPVDRNFYSSPALTEKNQRLPGSPMRRDAEHRNLNKTAWFGSARHRGQLSGGMRLDPRADPPLVGRWIAHSDRS